MPLSLVNSLCNAEPSEGRALHIEYCFQVAKVIILLFTSNYFIWIRLRPRRIPRRRRPGAPYLIPPRYLQTTNLIWHTTFVPSCTGLTDCLRSIDIPLILNSHHLSLVVRSYIPLESSYQQPSSFESQPAYLLHHTDKLLTNLEVWN